MYNIKQAAARAGVTVPVLRAWERRYGIVSPPRTASGYRRFDDEAVARIRLMRALVDDGWSPSAAAAAIVAGQVPGGDGTAASRAAASESSPGAPDAGSDAGPGLAARFIDAARDLDRGALEAVLDDVFARGSFERVTSDLLFPLLRRLGDAWEAGDVSVAGEHFVSAAVMRRLGIALEAAGAGARLGGGPRVVVGLPAGGRHELGALAFAVAGRRAGLDVTYVGPDLPAPDWITAAGAADAAVIGVVTRRDRRAATGTARALRTTRPGLLVAFGGRGAPEEPGVLVLPEPLPRAVDVVGEALGQTRP